VTSRAAPTNVISKQLSFCYGIALKENCQALLVLGHQRRLPSASASLVEEISQRVFVLTCVSSELDYHSLVFFHRWLEIMSRSTPTVSLPDFWNQNGIERVKEFPSLTIIRHPLVQRKPMILRDQKIEI
jgi:hypothetical protein